jgi:spermidine/putrescine transport system permease protein
MENRNRAAYLVSPPAVYLLFLFILPLGIMAVFSFRAGTVGVASQQFTLDNYREFIQNTAYHRLLWRSALIAFTISAVSVVVTFLTLIIVPTWTSYLLRIFAWKLILGSKGLLSSLLLWLGVIERASPILLYSRTAVVITLIYVWVPFVALPIFAALERIDRNLLEAAADLGCRPWEAFLRVTLPLSLPGVIAGFMFALIPTLGEFVTPLLVGGGQGSMYGNLIQDQFVRALNWPMGSVMSLAMLVLVLLLIFTFLRAGSGTKLLEY